MADCFLAEYRSTVPGCFEGQFDILNARFEFGSPAQIDWRFKGDDGNRQIRRANLAQFGFVSAAMVVEPRRTVDMIGVLVPAFLATANFERASDFSELWHPYIASRRILALTSAFLLVPTDLRDSPSLRSLDEFIRLNVAFVLRNLETELGFNHLERNLAALALFALAAGSMPPPIELALQRNFNAIVAESIGDDGVQKERSAMYQGLTVQSLRIFSALSIWSKEQRSLLLRRLAGAEKALSALTLGDDQPVLFNDGWLGEAPPTSALIRSDATGFFAMPQAGYVRLADDVWTVVMDAGAIGPASNPGHGHPDFLAIEASIGSDRLIVDPGTFSYSAGSAREQLRAWTAHNGPAFTGPKPVVFIDSFKVGKRSEAEIVQAKEENGVQEVTGCLAFDDVKLWRTTTLLPGRRLSIFDRWEGGYPRQTRFLVPASWAVEGNGTKLTLRRNSHRLTMTVEGAELSVGKAIWSRLYGVAEDAHEIVVRPAGDNARVVFAHGADPF